MKKKSIDGGQDVSGKQDPGAGLPPAAAKLARMAERAEEAEVFAKELLAAAADLKAECAKAVSEYMDDPVRKACKKAKVRQFVSDGYFNETLDRLNNALLRFEEAECKADNVIRGWEVEPLSDAPDSPRYRRLKKNFRKES